jgi:hypothetical protein
MERASISGESRLLHRRIKMFRKIFAMLAIMLAMIGAGSATMYYVMYNIPVEFGSTGEPGDVVDVTELASSDMDGYWTLLRIYDIGPTQTLAVPKTCSKLTGQQWNDTETQTGGYDGALELFGVDEIQVMY